MKEQVILVDHQDTVIGAADKMVAHRENLLHRAFSVFIVSQMNHHLEILLQQRALNKYHSAGLWTNACCSHPYINEETMQAAKRRLKEELGIWTALVYIGCFHYNVHFDNRLYENELDHVFIGTIDIMTKLVPNPQEVLAYRWISSNQLKHELAVAPNTFTVWFQKGFELVQQYYLSA